MYITVHIAINVNDLQNATMLIVVLAYVDNNATIVLMGLLIYFLQLFMKNSAEH